VGDIAVALTPAMRSTLTPALASKNGSAVMMNPATSPKLRLLIPMTHAAGAPFSLAGRFIWNRVSIIEEPKTGALH